MDELEFERWRRLAEGDIAAFVAERRRAINGLIERTPPERRAKLEALQDEIDLLRAMTPSAGKVMQSMLEMIGERIDALHQASGRLREEVQRLAESVPTRDAH